MRFCLVQKDSMTALKEYKLIHMNQTAKCQHQSFTIQLR